MSRALSVVVLALAALLVLLMLSCRPARPANDPLGPNAGCYVCHLTFVREELATTHLAARVPCTRCHGLSAAHANDENIGKTKPDVMIKGAQINPFCRRCHASHDVAPEKVVARWRERAASKLPSAAPPPTVACTDCHGHHKIAKQP